MPVVECLVYGYYKRRRRSVLFRSTTGVDCDWIVHPMASNSVLICHCSAAVIFRRRECYIAYGTGGYGYGYGGGFKSIRLQRKSCCSSIGKSMNSDAFVVASDDKYGSKQNISLTPILYDYILSNVREPEILRQLREETATMRGSMMQVSPDQAQLLAMLVQILGARRCIEVGVYTGYSSLAVALALPESGCLVACEKDAVSLEVAKKYYELAGVSDKVIVMHGSADETLNSLIKKGEAFSYDFAFIDADKRMNQEYFDLLLKLVRVGGVIVVDNVLWHGKVVDPLVNDARTVSIRNFNEKLMQDNRVSISMVPIGDGMTICRKR